MSKRFCHAGLRMALFLAMTACSGRAEQPLLSEVSHRDTQRTSIVDQALRSSVNIHTEKRQKSMDVVFSAGKATKINGMGTGIVVDERGYIVTNYHVVQDVERLRVTTYTGAEYEARVLAYDSLEDLAIIKIDPREPMTVARFGTSSDLMLGEDVMAIGNAFGYEDTVTRGIISHRSRDVEVNEQQSYKDLIQIDAAINPGNSGGPLINADGEVIGINVAIRAGAQRIGFAIPIDDARRVIARLINIERHDHTYHGIATVDMKQGRDRKLLVQAIRADSPALAAGLKQGDVILRSGTTQTIDEADFERSLFGKPAGAEVPLVVRRGDETLNLSLKITELSLARRQAQPRTSSNIAALPEIPRQRANSWEVLGVQLQKVNGGFPVPGQPYRGGMKVTAIREQSPAQANGIREGDILVGLHVWETISDDNVDFVLNNPQLKTIGPLKFYIVRNGETLFGHFPPTIAAAAAGK